MASPLFQRILNALVAGRTNTADITGATLSGGIYDSRSLLTPFLGNASSASRLNIPRTINGVPFDGSKDISVTITEFTIPPIMPYLLLRNPAGQLVPVYLFGVDGDYYFDFGKAIV